MTPAAAARPRVHADLENLEYRSWRRFLWSADRWPLERIQQYQISEVRRVVGLGYHRTRGYRALFDEAAVAPSDIRTLEDVRRLPFVDKEQLRDRLDDFTMDVAERTYVTTGGSTGIPFGMYRGRRAFARELASKAHQYGRVGWREGDRQLVLRGLSIDAPDHVELVERFQELRCSSYHLVPESMNRYVELAHEYRPLWLRCYPSAGCILARYLRETGQRLPPLKGILCASENLYDDQKALLTEVFGARVFSHYGHYELAALAGFCEGSDRYHVLPQYGHVELVGRDGRIVDQPGQLGEIVATSFLMDATLILRYRTSDLAVFGAWSCEACGRPYQIWDRIEGRLQEFIVTGTGRYISMTAMNMHTPVFDPLRQFQFHQERAGAVDFRYVPKGPVGDAALGEIREALARKLGGDVELRLQAVPEIPMTHRGKHRFLVQKLPLSFADL
ncbi:MAG: phenylacetate--CoA ligase family protein [Acidobacteria bacterium]|nr:phenylacetate--CoA ligase family protein [Acidobacteriota bacterium]